MIVTLMYVALRKAYIKNTNYEKLFEDGKNAVKEVVKGRIQLFGSSNKD